MGSSSLSLSYFAKFLGSSFLERKWSMYLSSLCCLVYVFSDEFLGVFHVISSIYLKGVKCKGLGYA